MEQIGFYEEKIEGMGFEGKKRDFMDEKMEGMGFYRQREFYREENVEQGRFYGEKMKGMGFGGKNWILWRKKHGVDGVLWIRMEGVGFYGEKR